MLRLFLEIKCEIVNMNMVLEFFDILKTWLLSSQEKVGFRWKIYAILFIILLVIIFHVKSCLLD